MTLKAPIASAVVRLAQFRDGATQACLDQRANSEDALAQPRWALCLAQKAIDGLVLENNLTAINRMGEAQKEIARMITVVDSVLPKQRREFSMAEAAPVVAPLLDDVLPLIELVASLDPFLSATAVLFR